MARARVLGSVKSLSFDIGQDMAASESDYARRFGGVARLYGDVGLARLAAAHVCVVGIGGVGSWAVEALARSAVGKLTLIDLDHVSISNVNRQLPALTGQFGRAKISAMADRVRAINPECQIVEIDEFLTEDNLAAFLTADMAYVIDCIDQMRVKVAMVAYCQRAGLPLIVSGGAGGRIDATRIAIADLAATSGDPLLARVRAELRRQHGFERGGKKFGIQAVFSTETLVYPATACATDAEEHRDVTGLNCAGFGSSVAVTASFGMAAAGFVLAQLAKQDKQSG